MHDSVIKKEKKSINTVNKLPFERQNYFCRMYNELIFLISKTMLQDTYTYFLFERSQIIKSYIHVHLYVQVQRSPTHRDLYLFSTMETISLHYPNIIYIKPRGKR